MTEASPRRAPTGDEVRAVLERELAPVAPPCAVLLSGGVDSTSVLLAARALGKRPRAYSFRLADRESTDFRVARENARRLGVDFVPVVLPTDLATLADDVTFLVRGLGLRKKADVECAWPVVRALRAIAEADVLVGSAADGHFGLSKKAMIHHRGSVASLDAFRAALFARPDYAQAATLARYAASLGKRLHVPYKADGMVALFRGTSWESLNRPRQKMPIRASDDDFARLVVRPHTNLQKGDSGIAEHFEKLLATPLAPPGARATVAVYNAVARGGRP